MSQITKEEVFKAADKTAAEGIMPSILHIRESLEHRGSESTIGRYLKEWKQMLLKKNDVGCLFCHSMAQETTELHEELKQSKLIVGQLKDALTVMLQNPDRQIAVEEVMRRLQ